MTEDQPRVVTAVQTQVGPDAPPPPAPPADMPAELAGRYRVHADLARGGMGVVYRATDAAFGREVAVKTVQPQFADRPAVLARFVTESRITGRLQHPAIPPVYDSGRLPDGRPFLAMKLVRGDTLEALLKQRPDPATDLGRFVAAFEAVAQAVGYAHSKGVIHRDLKPANVMVGSFGEVQVMDWGLAKVLADRADPEATTDAGESRMADPRDSDADATRAGSLLGSPAYMAPEQALGLTDQLDRRTDVFGLGAVLSVVLTGQPPWAGLSIESIRAQALRGDLGECHRRLDDCRAEPELVALCRRCLAADRDARPADANAVAAAVAALRAAADDRARRAELDAAEGRVREAEGRKRRRVLALVGGLVLVGVSTAAAYLLRDHYQAEERFRTERERAMLDDDSRRMNAVVHEQEAGLELALDKLREFTDAWAVRNEADAARREAARAVQAVLAQTKLAAARAATLGPFNPSGTDYVHVFTPMVGLAQADALLEQGDVEEALRLFGEAAKRSPLTDYVGRRARAGLARAYLRAGRPADAAREFDAVAAVVRQKMAEGDYEVAAAISGAELAEACDGLAGQAVAVGDLARAAGLLAEAGTLHRLALGTPRPDPIRRTAYAAHHERIARLGVARHDPAAVRRAVAGLLDFAADQSVARYDAACFLCLLAKDVPAGGTQPLTDEAMEHLRQALRAGWADAEHTSKDPDLDPLRSRLDFRWLMAKLQAKNKPREVAPPPRPVR